MIALEKAKEKVYLLRFLSQVDLRFSQVLSATRDKKDEIDEIQDYSTVQCRLLSYLFPCKKTVLGDINPSVNPMSTSNVKIISLSFPNAATMTSLKSYRSTYEITTFAPKISPQVKVKAIERHGEIRQKIHLKSLSEEIKHLKNSIPDFKSRSYYGLGVIGKTQKQVEKLYDALKGDFNVQRLTAVSVALGSGVIITTAHLAKELEFDQVIVPHCARENYTSEPERQMLYVTYTQALHRLFMTFTVFISSFLIHNPEDYELSIV